MFGIARISELQCSKLQQTSSGRIDNAVLSQIADAIQMQYFSQPTRSVPFTAICPSLLGNLYGLLPFASRSMDNSYRLPILQESSLSTATITEAYRLGALVYLQTIVPGPPPFPKGAMEMASVAARFIHCHVPESQMDQCLRIPLFLTACMSTGDQRNVMGVRLCRSLNMG